MMKQYVALNRLTIIGKGWEVRHQLSKLASASDGLLLSRFTKECPPMRVKIGSADASVERSMLKVNDQRQPV